MARNRVLSGAGIVTAAAVAALVAGCGPVTSAANGGQDGHHGSAGRPGRVEVTGFFVREGGPIGPGGKQPPNEPLSGVVRFRSGKHGVVWVRVGKSGKFIAFLWPGTYAVVGQSPQLQQAGTNTSNGADAPCSQPRTVTVTAHQASKVTVACVVP
jgi:hypothetical protein